MGGLTSSTWPVKVLGQEGALLGHGCLKAQNCPLAHVYTVVTYQTSSFLTTMLQTLGVVLVCKELGAGHPTCKVLFWGNSESSFRHQSSPQEAALSAQAEPEALLCPVPEPCPFSLH